MLILIDRGCAASCGLLLAIACEFVVKLCRLHIIGLWGDRYVSRQSRAAARRKWVSESVGVFLLLGRHVPNVALGDIWHQYNYVPVEDRPTTDHRPRILENFQWRYLCNGSSDRVRVWFWGKNVREDNARGVISFLCFSLRDALSTLLGIVAVSRPSVRPPSKTLMHYGHVSWVSFKVITRLMLTPRSPNNGNLVQGEQPKIRAYRHGVAVLSRKPVISLKRAR